MTATASAITLALVAIITIAALLVGDRHHMRRKP